MCRWSKRSGEREEFNPLKIVSSMIRSGAPKEEAESILRTLEPKLYDGISTEEIYGQIHQIMKGRKAAHYRLKKALFQLGPEGKNFENYVARLFQAKGYETRTRQILNGKCIKHEVDVLIDPRAWKGHGGVQVPQLHGDQVQRSDCPLCICALSRP